MSPESPHPKGSLDRWITNPTVVSVSLFALVFVAYLPTFWNGFVTFDDDTYVYNNVQVKHGLNMTSVGWAFTTRLNGSWHPLTWISTLLDCQLFGMRAGGHHLSSLLIHAVTTVLVFRLFLQMTGSTGRCAFVAALFGLHPLHVESVAWISERKDVLCAFFWMLSLLMYVRYTEGQVQSLPSQNANGGSSSPRVSVSKFYLLSLFFFACGLMSKPMIVTLPLLLLLLDWWPLRRIHPEIVRPGESKVRLEPRYASLFAEKIPFIGLAAICGVITLSGQRALGAMMSAEDAPLYARALNAILSYGSYLQQSIWPAGLAVYYPYPKGIPLWRVVASILYLLLLSTLALMSVRRKPALTFGWLWFGLTLLPVIGLIQVGGQAHADRYMYVPLIGLSVMLAWWFGDFFAGWRYGKTSNFFLVGAVIISCMVLTVRQVTFWQDSESLYRRAIAVTQNNAVVENNLGDVLIAQGQFDEALVHCREAARLAPLFSMPAFNIGDALAGKGLLEEAITQYEVSLQRFPGDADIYERFGRILSLKGRTDKALTQFEKALNLNPNHPQAHCNLAIALVKLQRFDEAIMHFREAARLMPDYITPHNNLGALLGRKGRLAEAIDEFRIVLTLKPLDPVAHCNLADALASEGKFDEASSEYQAALNLAPRDPVAHRNLAVVLTRLGRVNEAAAHLSEAVQLRPDDSQTRSDLGIALGKLGRLDDAIEQLNQAVKINPNNVEALCNLGVALGAKGQMDAAIAHLEAALRLNPNYTNALNNLRFAQSLKSSARTNSP